MSEGLAIDVNPEVFKIKDPRVDKLKNGTISAELFSKMIGPGDPFMLVDGCIFAMSEEEFFASRAIIPINEMSESAFHYVLGLSDLSFMHQLDREYVEKAKEDLPNCPACRYKRYKNEITKLVKKYNIEVPEVNGVEELILADKAVYPDTTSPVVPLVSLMLQHMFRTELPKRRDCIDCVEKHVAQAAVLAGECVCGYPEHISFVIGHLGEAIDEMPDQLTSLKETLMFCLAKTKKDGKPFVPAFLLLPLINLARYELDQSMEDQKDSIVDERTDTMDIAFTDTMRDELSILPSFMLSKIKKYLEECIQCALNTPEDRMYWEGRMASSAECVGNMAPAFANMLRNRRLLFIGDISIAATGEWSGCDIIKHIEKCLE